MKLKKIFGIVFVFSMLPSSVFAQTVLTTLGVFETLGNIFFKVCSAAAFVAFAWGIAKVIFNTDDEKKRQEAKYVLIWSSIAMFVLVTIWGIVGYLEETIGNTNDPGQITIDVPDMP